MIAQLCIALALSRGTGSAPTPQGIDTMLAARYFAEARWASDDDDGKLWGKPIYGPMILVDPATRSAVANENPPEMNFEAKDGIYTGKLPEQVLIANTAIDWKGKRWSLVMWPLNATYSERLRLMLHESFHRLQPDLGLPAESPSNEHLATKDGRIWLILELKALRQAMITEPKDHNTFVEDALIFRAYRQSLVPGSKQTEDRMEINEGLAEFTGLMCRGTWEPETRLALGYRMRNVAERQSYPSSFAYLTGPAYALLLDLDEDPWRTKVKPDTSLSGMLAATARYKFTPQSDLKQAATERMAKYDGATLIAAETKREEVRLATERKWRELLVDGPVLELPLEQMNFTYDPNQVLALGSDGNIYPTSEIADAWGKIVVTEGARITPDYRKVFIAAPTSQDKLSGPGWTLKLNAGWTIAPAARAGSFIVTKR